MKKTIAYKEQVILMHINTPVHIAIATVKYLGKLGSKKYERLMM